MLSNFLLKNVTAWRALFVALLIFILIKIDSPEMLKGMFKKFGKLDKEEKGFVSTADLNNVCAFKEDSLGKVVSDKMSAGFRDQIDFKCLVKNLSVFYNNDEEAKLHFLFNLLDSNSDGFLTADELIFGFKYVMLDHLNESDVNEIAIQTVKFADTDGDNALNFDEFKNFYKNVLQITI